MNILLLLLEILAISGRVVRIETPNDFRYMYLEDHGVTVRGYSNISFLLQANNDGHIALSRYKDNWNSHSYEVVIGGWKNRRSAIRQCDQCAAKVSIENSPLNKDELRPFWVSWTDGHIRIGKGTKLHVEQFLSWIDSDPEPVNHVGVSTGWGSNGTWIFGAVDGGWSEWTTWSACSTSCEGGSRTRKRYCNNPAPAYGDECGGEWLREGLCNDFPCAVDGGWSSWGVYGPCSHSCGSGTRSRFRSCDNPPTQNGGATCKGDEKDTTPCRLKECPVDGMWSEWTPWSSCSKSCGTGEITRRRRCDDPAPQHGGQRCSGSAIESETCQDTPCPVDGGWSQWSGWSNCSVTCGEGFLFRSRACDQPIPAHGGENCDGDGREQVPCNDAPCPVPGSWSKWSVWEPCTLTCGGGNRSRIRFCDDPLPMYGAPDCAGPDIETSTCNNFPCPVDGSWTGWGSWTACTASCGAGRHSRVRRCSNPSPDFGGARCRGPSFQQETCVNTKCPVDGSYSEWNTWSSCSHTCGPGHVQRSRECDSPEPRYGGFNCSGDWLEVDECILEPCPVDGGYTEWSPWSQCSATCGPGFMTKARWCIFPRPQFGGRPCEGEATNETECMDDYCPIDGAWSSWGPWDTCTASCEGGTRVRYRTCTAPPPQYGGRECLGVSIINETCNIQRCPVPIGWSPWESWTECSVSCGGGYMTRFRVCDDPNAFNCVGSDLQNWTCAFVDCPEHWVAVADDEPTEAPGAVGIGVMSIVFMSLIPAICIFIDLLSLPAHIRYAHRNIRHFRKTLLLLRARFQNREVRYVHSSGATASLATSTTTTSKKQKAEKQSNNKEKTRPSPIAHTSSERSAAPVGRTLSSTAILAPGSGVSSEDGGSPDSSLPGSPRVDYDDEDDDDNVGDDRPPGYDNAALDVSDIVIGRESQGMVSPGNRKYHAGPVPRTPSPLVTPASPRHPTDVCMVNHLSGTLPVLGLTAAQTGNHDSAQLRSNHVGVSYPDVVDFADLTPGKDQGTMTQQY